jgi:hypothetical protein
MKSGKDSSSDFRPSFGISCTPPSIHDHSKLAIPTLYTYSVIVDHPAMTSTEQQHRPLRMLSIGTVTLSKLFKSTGADC